MTIEKKKQKKRTTMHVSHETYENVKKQSKEADMAMQKYLKDICDEICDGLYDDIIPDKSAKEFKSMGIDQETSKKTINYLKDKNVTLLEAISLIVKEKE